MFKLIKNNSMSHISFLFLWFLAAGTIVINKCHGISHVGCFERERRILLSFKQDIVDPSNLLATWAGDGDCCRWAGVVCDNMTGHIRELHLGNPYSTGDFGSQEFFSHWRSKLGGKLNPCLVNLKHLNFLNLSNNNFQGIQIPTFLGSMKSLRYLDLSSAEFSGMIPYQLGNLSNLRYLDLQSSNVGTLGVENLQWLLSLSSLTHLDLSYVNLENASDWLQVTSTLPSLVALRLSGCLLFHLPSISNANFSSLTILDLSWNYIGNSLIPSWLTELNGLVSLDLALNRFQGPIPDWLRNMTSLRDLDLSGNSFNSSIPDWLYSYSQLEFLNLGYNQLQGSISGSIGNLTSAVTLDLSSNKLGGGIPTSLGNLCNLRLLDLSRVPLNQTITDVIDILSGCISSRLESLNLMSSLLSGHLTNQLGQFRRLVDLDLRINSISGPIPEAIGELSSLRFLWLSLNKLNGPLPASLGQLANLEMFYISKNLLKGIVSEVHFANLTRLSGFEGSGNQLMLNVSPDWVPPFQLQSIGLASWHLGPQFPPWLRTQKNFWYLDISDSKIADTVPTWFWNLSSQYNCLNLSHNQIDGTIPEVIGAASLFVYFGSVIDLSSNHFQGPLPRISSSVTALDLSHNSLSGSIGHFLCDRMNESKQLQVLNLGDNLLSEEIPDCWTPWQFLVAMNLGNNKFTGVIPNSMGTLSQLQTLHLRGNRLSGEISMSVLENCTDLETLDLAENRFSGRIPSGIGQRLPKMKVMILRSNSFDSSIPDEFCSLASLQILDIAHNKFYGSIPSCVNNFSAMTRISNSSDNYITSNPFQGGFYENVELVMKGILRDYGTIFNFVRSMDLSGNNLSGEIPGEVTSLETLQSLNLSYNYFTGRIPDNIGAMSSLESLDFSVNQLVGEIPSSMSALAFLSHLNLSYNKLTGKIPTSTQLQSFDAYSFLGNQLCGLPLAENCTEGDARPKIDGSGEEADKEMVGFYVSMAIGFVVSFWSVFGSLVINRRWRHAYFRFLDRMSDKCEGVVRMFC